MSEEKVETGDTVKVNYTGKFEDGGIFDSSKEEEAKKSENFNPERNYEPLVIKVGEGQIIKGFDDALVGMKKGEKKDITVPPEEGYGNYDPSLVQSVPMEAFQNAGITPEVGQLLNTSVGIGKVAKVNQDDVEVDFNNPLAGKTLNFEIKVEDIVSE